MRQAKIKREKERQIKDKITTKKGKQRERKYVYNGPWERRNLR